jgi:hypothetical protein
MNKGPTSEPVRDPEFLGRVFDAIEGRYPNRFKTWRQGQAVKHGRLDRTRQATCVSVAVVDR